MNRRTFNTLLMSTPLMSTIGYAGTRVQQQLMAAHSKDESYRTACRQFETWAKSMQPDPNSALVQYMTNAGHNKPKLSIIASTKLALYRLAQKNLSEAIAIGDELVQWVEISNKEGSRHSKGGLPSEIIYDNRAWQLGDYYYASDNLISVYVLYRLYQVTRDTKYGLAALRLGNWLDKTLFDGKAYGVWKTNYGMPMHYLRGDGAVDNTIHTAGDFLWLKSLPMLHHLMPKSGWLDRLGNAKTFMQNAQMESGAWYTYFKPDNHGRSGKWYGFGGENITIGDDNLRSALAAQNFGMDQQVDRFRHWLMPYEDTLLWGYLHTDVSQPKFLPQDTPYFDVVCTGLLRSWYRQLGNSALADKCQEVLLQTQSANGGWCWAVTQKGLEPLNQQQAMVTGCWALVDVDGV